MLSAREVGMAGVEHHDVGALADLDRADIAAECLCTAGERARIEPGAGRLALPLRQHVAATVAQALRVFELAQLGGGLDLDVGIRADAETTGMFEETPAVKNAIAERSLGQRAQARDGARGRK